MRRPKGIKTKKAVTKRFKITATGKVLRSHAGRRHLAQTKNAKRIRRLGKSAHVDHRICQPPVTFNSLPRCVSPTPLLPGNAVEECCQPPRASA